MRQGHGLPVFPGVAIGNAVVYRKSERNLPVSSGDPALEQAKFNAALETCAGKGCRTVCIDKTTVHEDYVYVIPLVRHIRHANS